MNSLLRTLNCEPKAQLQRTAGAQLRLVLSQIAVAERKSPGDREAVLGVMVQLAAAVDRRRAEMKKSANLDELADLPLRLVGLYLETRIAVARKQISLKDAEQMEGLMESALLKSQVKSGCQT